MKVMHYKSIWASLFYIVTMLSLTGCAVFWDAPQTTVTQVTDWGRDINQVYSIVTIICAFVFVLVAVPLIYVIYRFRERPGDESIPKQITGNHILELTWTIVPVILLVFIFVPTARIIFDQAKGHPEGADVLVVKVIGHQWWWEFQYPDYNLTTANEVHLPENRPVRFEITSADVIHSFWVPRFGGKIDALPGVTNLMHLVTPPATGIEGGDYYQGQCYELCGLSHAIMRYQAVIHSSEAFERWAAAHQTPPAVETSKEKRGMELFGSKGCIACHVLEGVPYAAGVIGPNLNSFGSRKWIAAEMFLNTQENLSTWLKHPQVKPGSLMVIPMELNEHEISDLVAFLRNSTVKRY